MSKFIPPDWRNASAYPLEAKDLSDSQWAWEFLRRNPDYQKDYEHFAGLPSYHANGSKTCKWCNCQPNWWDDPELRYCKHPILDDITVEEYVRRTGDDTPYHYSLEDHLVEKWGFTSSMIYDPAYDGGSLGLYCEPEFPIELNIWDSKIYPELSQSHPIEPNNIFEVTLRFDCRYSIEKQLNEAKEILLQNREGLREHAPLVKNSKSIRIKNLPSYLRAYDGWVSGATLTDIKETISSGTDKDAIRQSGFRACENGKKLVYGGYRELIG